MCFVETQLSKDSIMITAFIRADYNGKALTRTLAALIGATVEGLVRDVVILANADDEAAHKIADEAGCHVLKLDGFAAAVQSAKSEWLMILEAGAVPEQGWQEAIGNQIQFEHGKALRFTRSPLAPRPFFKRLLQPELPLALGLIIEKRHALTLGETALNTPQGLAKAAKPKPMPAALRPA
jgi:hypothetical protein